MSGQPKTTKSVFIPAPVDGLNLIANPSQLLATEARELNNYFPYQWGIRERPIATNIVSSAVTSGDGKLWLGTSAEGVERLFITYQSGGVGKIGRLDTTSDTTLTEKGGATTYASNPTVVLHSCQFNNRLFSFCYLQPPFEYNLVAEGNCADVSFTGPTLTTISTGFNYKSRMYFIQGNYSGEKCSVWYGAVDAISGAMTKVNFQSIFERSGALAYGFSWSYNQGNQNEELFCLYSTSGELLIYSGDYPTATNWALLARLQLPPPQLVGSGYAYVAKVGSEILIPTSQGIIPLSKVFAGVAPEASYIRTSLKLGSSANKLVELKYQPSQPFLYAAPLYDSGYLPSRLGVFVQNVETSAWSSIWFQTSIFSVMPWENYLYVIHGTDIVRLDLDGTSGVNSSDAYTKPSWKTPFFDFGSHVEKHSKHVRLISKDFSAGLQVKATCGIKTDFIDDTSLSSTDSRSVTATSGAAAVCELAPAGIGKRISYVFKKIPTGERNEIYGFEAVVDEGGRY